jgi:hypothetical protein
MVHDQFDLLSRLDFLSLAEDSQRQMQADICLMSGRRRGAASDNIAVISGSSACYLGFVEAYLPVNLVANSMKPVTLTVCLVLQATIKIDDDTLLSDDILGQSTVQSLLQRA